MKNFAKGVVLTSLVFSTGIGVGLYFLRKYHEEKVCGAHLEAVEDFINSGAAAKYANGEISLEELPLCELSPDEDCEIIVRRRSHKK